MIFREDSELINDVMLVLPGRHGYSCASIENRCLIGFNKPVMHSLRQLDGVICIPMVVPFHSFHIFPTGWGWQLGFDSIVSGSIRGFKNICNKDGP